jgi:hypothetical protein
LLDGGNAESRATSWQGEVALGHRGLRAPASGLGPTLTVASWAAALLLACAFLVAPSAVASTADEIIITNASDDSDGDVSSVDALLANPGPDGISLREALEATDNDPGSYSIRFDGALAGSTITLNSALPPLTGGGVTVEGDIDGDGLPDVTLRPPVEGSVGFQISSSGNRLHALSLTGFVVGVLLQPYWPYKLPDPGEFPNHKVFSDNSVSGLVMQGIGKFGIYAASVASPTCGAPETHPCRSYNTWANTTITANTIESSTGGIDFGLTNTGDRVEGAAVTDNTIRIVGKPIGPGIGLEVGGDSTAARISDVLIARNSIEGGAGIGIDVAAGVERAQAGTVEGVRVLGNRLHLVSPQFPRFCCQGIVVQAGSDSPSFAKVPPVRYLDDNLVRNVVVRGNSVTGHLAYWAASVQAGIGGGGRHNRVHNIRIKGNVLRSSMPTFGVYVWTSNGMPYKKRYATDNRISGIWINANQISIGTGPGFKNAGGGTGASGVALLGGGIFSRSNVVRDARIAKNRIKTAYVGIKLIGGLGPTARGNRVTCVQLAGNRVIGTPKALSVRSNVRDASGNRASLGC